MATTNNQRYKKNTSTPKIAENELGKLPPQAIELEEKVLGALMIEKDAYSNIADLLRPESFYEHKNGLIFEAIRALAVKEEPIDSYTVAEKLKSLGNLTEIGGIDTLTHLTRDVASTAHLRYHAQIVAQKATARDLIAMAAQLEEEGYDETQDVEEIMQHAEAKIFEISQRTQKREVTQIDPVISEALQRIDKAAQNEGNISGIPSGFTELDKVTSGWQESSLVIIAARPAMGKTAFVLSMAKNIAVDYKIPVALFSLEMSNVELVNRLIMNVCEIEGSKIKTGKLTGEERKRLDTKINELLGAPLYVDDSPSLSVFELQSKARKLVREHDIKMIIIDYLQLMNAQGMNFGSREQEVSTISRNLKALAKELSIPIIALSQLNRGVEARTGNEGKKPQLSDLRESGAIEQDADMVCFIHRPEYYHIYQDEKTGLNLQGLADIIIAKHRSGGLADIYLRFEGKFTKFKNNDGTANEEPDQNIPQYTSSSSRINSMSSDGANFDLNNSLGDDGAAQF